MPGQTHFADLFINFFFLRGGGEEMGDKRTGNLGILISQYRGGGGIRGGEWLKGMGKVKCTLYVHSSISLLYA